MIRTTYDAETDQHVQDSVARQQRRDAASRIQREQQREQEEAAKRQKFNNLTTIKDLSKDEYREMRFQISYRLPRTSHSHLFHRMEQELIYREHYGSLTKNEVAPPHVLDFEHLQHLYFSDAMWVCEKLRLFPLMKIQEHYNVQLV